LGRIPRTHEPSRHINPHSRPAGQQPLLGHRSRRGNMMPKRTRFEPRNLNSQCAINRLPLNGFRLGSKHTKQRLERFRCVSDGGSSIVV
jgi:hypothetical protein